MAVVTKNKTIKSSSAFVVKTVRRHGGKLIFLMNQKQRIYFWKNKFSMKRLRNISVSPNEIKPLDF